MDKHVNDVAEDLSMSKAAGSKPKRPSRVSEIEALRTENRKVFCMDDGTQQAIFYPGMIHTPSVNANDQSYKENSLELDTDGKHFSNRRGRFNASFNCDSNSNELFSMEMDNHRVTVHTVQKSNQYRSTPYKKEGVHNAILFRDMTDSVDIEYALISNGIKENIIVNGVSETYCYPFKVECENLSIQNDAASKQITFISKKTGQEVFCIPAPFMMDENREISLDVSYEVKVLSERESLITVVADPDWINDCNRVFPVTIDPQIMIAGTAVVGTYAWTNGYTYSGTAYVGTNYIENTSTHKRTYYKNRVYVPTRISILPGNPRIKKAELTIYQADCINELDVVPKLGLFHVTEDITSGEHTPAQSDMLIDVVPMKAASEKDGTAVSYVFDITKYVDAFYSGEIDKLNFVVRMLNEDISCNSYAIIYGNYQTEYAPNICVTYESSYGVNTSYRMHTHELGRFGQGSVDLACGNLMFECQDFGWAGNRMPVTIKRLYTSALSAYQYTKNSGIKLDTADFSAMKLGFGWKLNIMQSMMPTSFQHEGNMYNGYVYIGENGDEWYFKQSDEQDTNNEGVPYNLFEAVDDSSMIYDPKKLTLKQGGEIYLFDEAGRLLRISDEWGNGMSITYTNDRIVSVTDGVDRAFVFVYDNEGQLTSITAPDATCISYTYVNGHLSGVSYPDGSKAIVSSSITNPKISVSMYDSESNLLSAVEYSFANDRVSSVAEYGVEEGNNILGKMSAYSYSASARSAIVRSREQADADEGETTYTEVITVYSLNDDGDVIGEYVYSQDQDKIGVEGTGEGIHPYYGNGGISTIGISNNLLMNHNFDNSTYWNMTQLGGDIFSCSRRYDETTAKYGKCSLVIESSSDQCLEQGLQQAVSNVCAGEYTFSAYLRVARKITEADNPGAYIRVVDAAGNVLAESEHLSAADREYIRISVSFELESNQDVTVQVLMDGKGVVYANAAQLERGASASDYNMILNGNFTNTEDWNWVMSAGAQMDSSAYFSRPNALMITGNLDEKRNAYQVVPVFQKRSTRENFTLSGWAKGCGIPVHDRDDMPAPQFRLRAVVHYNDSDYGDTSEETFTADFSPCTEDWQYASVQFAKSKYRQIGNIEVFCDYDHNSGTAYFDDIQLVRNSVEKSLSPEDFPEEVEDTIFDDIEGADDNNIEAPEHTELRDAFGNPLTETTFTDGEFGTIYHSFGYDANGNDLIRETDARGNTTVYTVDTSTSRNSAVTDRCGNKTVYEYDDCGRTAKVTSKDAQDTELANVSYTYDAFDNLTEIVRGDGLKYILQYNEFHNMESIGVDSKTEKLVSYTYKTGNGRLKQISYANGDYMKATYNNLGQMVSEKWYDASETLTAHYKYAYDCQGNIVRSVDILACKEYNYSYEDGQLLRSAEFDITVSADGIITAKRLVSELRYTYDMDGNLIRKRIIPVSGSEQVIYYENAEGKNTVVKFATGGNTVTSHSKNDSFGRKVFDELQLGSGFVSRQFLYHAGQASDEYLLGNNGNLKSTPTTNLVSKIILSDGRTLSYEYDAEERITKVVDSVGGTTVYTYDAQGQLTEERILGATSDEDIVVNAMTYDGYGNILTKNGKSYTYGDSVWKDKLTAYDGQSISYDAQGNPTAYLGHTLTWEKGRQLKSFDSNTYTYNANGIRTSKTVDGVKHTYTLDGTKILREAWDDNVLIPLYDNEDSVCGIVYNDKPYFFLKNLQSDVIAITNEDGQTVVEYDYDAWGVCTIVEDASGLNIAAINPFRYRGYYYDDEIGMYYLQSRYYTPELARFLNSDDSEVAYLGNCAQDTNLYSYCQNNSVMLSDESGMFSLNDLFKKVSGFLQKLFNKFIDNLKKQIQITKKYIKISVTAIKLVLDLAVTLVVNKLLKWGIEKVIGFVMKKYIQKSPKSFIQFLGKVLNHSATKWLIKALMLKALNLGYIRSVNNAVKSVAVDTILSASKVLSKINSICSACSSVSGLIAFILDLADRKWDDYLTISFA